ncbi:MAG: DNA alkylation repair protein [Elusimicrobiota bacterium]
MKLPELRRRLRRLADKDRAKVLRGFFKTGKGEYGEGDVFIGVTVPEIRRLAKESRGLSLSSLKRLIRSRVHEERLCALLILILKYRQGGDADKKACFGFYVRNMGRVNNWDLVDLSAEHVVGAYLSDKSKRPLARWARSKDLWKRRIAILSTFHYVKKGEFSETSRIAGMLLDDKEDLIHKAVGWMLREIGKRDMAEEEGFLARHHKRMPRTMLRYAIERFPERKRQTYLKGNI